MWQRFTERARRTVFYAQEEAGRVGENYVSTEHLLLGLVRENDCVAARILDRMGVSLSRIRSEIERQVTRGDGKLGQDMQLTPRSKRVIDLAYDEARQLSNNYIGTEHLLLGLIREGEGLAGRVLTKLGVELERTRREVMLMQTTDAGKPAARPPEDLSQTLQDLETRLSAMTVELQSKLVDNMDPTLKDIAERLSAMTDILKNKSGRIPSEATAEHPDNTSALDSVSSLINAVSTQLKQRKTTTARLEMLTRTLSRLISSSSGWRRRSLLSLKGVQAQEIGEVMETASLLKLAHRNKLSVIQNPYPRTLALLFEKPSLRTRVSFEAGMGHLGGQTIYLAPGDVGLGTRETVPDVAAALSKWVDVIAARVFRHETLEELELHSSIPVINALSDREHPLQAFADLLTIQERKGALGNRLKLAYIGDGNNVLHALLLACAKVGINVTAACPEGYGPEASYLEEAQRIGAAEGGTGAQIAIVTDPVEAVAEADVLYTDVWASMGQEEEREERTRIFAPYQVNMELVAKAKPDCIVLHCLPAHREEEITADVMEAHKEVIMDQAENRLHTQKALLALMLGLSA